MTTYQKLLAIRKNRGCGFMVLLDPDRLSSRKLALFAASCEKTGADAFLFGSSIMIANHFEKSLRAVKNAVNRPVIIFPGSSAMVSRHADAILFLSMISGRNPDLLISEHVKAAPALKQIGLEPIPTAYMLIESGVHTAVSFISNTFPIPSDKPDIARVHALAGQYLGMKLVYLEAGSGAKRHVPVEMARQVCEYVDIPVIVGGGIRDENTAHDLARTGASFIVIGNALEDSPELAKSFARAIHLR